MSGRAPISRISTSTWSKERRLRRWASTRQPKVPCTRSFRRRASVRATSSSNKSSDPPVLVPEPGSRFTSSEDDGRSIGSQHLLAYINDGPSLALPKQPHDRASGAPRGRPWLTTSSYTARGIDTSANRPARMSRRFSYQAPSRGRHCTEQQASCSAQFLRQGFGACWRFHAAGISVTGQFRLRDTCLLGGSTKDMPPCA